MLAIIISTYLMTNQIYHPKEYAKVNILERKLANNELD